MPGLTNNDDILSGINQIIAALNDSCCPDVIVRELGVGFADEPQPEEAVEFGPPPDRWEAIDNPGSPAYYNRKCATANQIADAIVSVFNAFDSYGLEVLGTLAFGVAVGAFASIMASTFAGPFAPLIGVAAAAVTLTAILIAGGWNAAVISGIVTAHRQEIICAMFEASDAATAKAAVLDIFNTEGANPTEVLILSNLFTLAGTMNNLFATNGEVPPPAAGPTSCEECNGDCPELIISLGEITSGALAVPGTVTIESVTRDFGPGDHEYIIVRTSPACPCQHFSFKVTAITLPGSEAGGGVQICDGTWIYNHDYPPLDQEEEGYLIQVLRTPEAGHASITIQFLGWV